MLENMHCILVVQLLRKHGFGFLLESTTKPSHPEKSSTEDSTAGRAPISPATEYPFSLPTTPVTASGLSPPNAQPGAITDFKGFKKLLVSTVLATDMSMHFSWIKDFKQLGRKFRNEVEDSESEQLESSEEQDRIILCQAIIKCADISNPVSVKGVPPWRGASKRADLLRDITLKRPDLSRYPNIGLLSY